MRRVMSEEPERLRGLVPHVPRDLETIVTKAIAREPAERYASAAALAEDLQRFLDDKPIKARRVTAAEQAWRWSRRNPAVASLAAGLLSGAGGRPGGRDLAVAAGGGQPGAAESANRKAQARFDLAMEAVRAFTTGASEDVILKEKALEGLRKKLLGQSRLFYEKLTGSLEGEMDRASRSALAEALFDAGTLYAKVDAPQKGLESLRQSLVLRAALVREHPTDPAARRDLGAATWRSRSCSIPWPRSTTRGPSWTGRGRCSCRWRGSGPATAAPGGWRPSVPPSMASFSAGPGCPPRGGQPWSRRGAVRGPDPG